jgi:hypothetical protein
MSSESASRAQTAQDLSAKGPEELQRDIDATRRDLGDTVDALSQKADVKAQLRQAADEQKARLAAKRDEVKQHLPSGGGDAAVSRQAQRAMGGLAQRTRERPLPYLGGALVVGVVLAQFILPARRTR